MPDPIRARAEREIEVLGALARKYRTLAELRRARSRGEPIPERSVFKALADEFPGALRELDTVHLEEIDARADALERVVRGEPGALRPWMQWLHGYHSWMRAALWIKARVRRGILPDGQTVERLADGAARRAGLPIDAGFVRAVMAPPAGRLRPVVLARIAEAGGVTTEAITRAIFSSDLCARDSQHE
jgi:hypothetical protein